jgi:parallel beta-helix repeat protein
MVKNKFKSIRTLQLILAFLILHSTFYICTATIRYVSHSGSNTPPYTTWETAADSIMFAINISVFGDTIYVANGVYEEQVVMIPGLTLIGAGMDSCVIDTRSLASSGFNSVTVKDSCIFRDFQVIVAHQNVGNGIYCEGIDGYINMNKIRDGVNGIISSLDSDFIIEHNICENNRIGIRLWQSNSLVTNNIIYSNYEFDTGVNLLDLNGTSIAVIESNYIETNHFGIQIAVGTYVTTIVNNIFVLNTDNATAFVGANSDTVKIFNNLIIAEDARSGIANSIIPSLNIGNEFFGNFSRRAINAENFNIIKNNNVTNGQNGIIQESGDNPVIQYNNSWSNNINFGGFAPDSTNLSVDPMIVNEDTTKGKLDFHLQMFSPLIDAGDPNIFDRDGSRSDIGLYGGPYGWSYTYQDLAPRPPHNVTAVIEDGLVKLTWNKNTEADFSHYRIYRDTVSIIIYDSTKIIGETTDTVFYDDLPPENKEKRYYYLITAFDNQGNQSEPGEEVYVTVTGLTEHPPVDYDGYRLLSNYPNPFNPSTIIPYRLKEGGYVKLYIYDIKGELVTTLVNQWQEKGYYEVRFQPNVRERQRANSFEVPMGKTYSDIATGVYIYMIQVKSDNNIPVFSDMGKMILLK